VRVSHGVISVRETKHASRESGGIAPGRGLEDGVVAERIDLEDVFRDHQRGVFAYLLRVTGDRALAEDLAQDVFLRALTSAAAFRRESSVRTWLFVIARNVLASYYRRHDAAALLTDDVDVTFDVDPVGRLGIEEALQLLAVPAREALVLVDLLGFEPAAAAELVGLTSNAFRVRLHRARASFRKAYAS
jgi:RNA polymerase sigma-70 factor, ECF subfamily